MFAQAIRTASHFTFPYVGIRRRECGHVYSTIGAFVVINAEGWAITSAHVVEEILSAERETQERAGTTDSSAEDSCVQHVEIWALPSFEKVQARVEQAVIRPLADIAVVKLQPFDGTWLAAYPVLRDAAASPIEQGMSVCRLGYPFHDIQGSWDEQRREFSLPTGAFPVPSFALDGIVARFHRVTADDGSGEATFIETSTPGLRGQSGGPLFDATGRICGIQSHTAHLDLGFDARFSAGEQVVTERQFLNVGAATHVNEMRSLLDEAHVDYQLG